GSNSGDGGNTTDGVKITGGVIEFSGGIGDAVARRTSMAGKRKVVIVKILTLFSITMALEPLPEDILGVTIQRHTGSHYPKTYWEHYPKTYWEHYPKTYWA
nr:hypothetical protein [Tanacetum cinerariifolium]